MINRELILEILTRHLGDDSQRFGTYEDVVNELMHHTGGDWLSVWEHHPEPNKIIPHCSVPVLWLDSEDKFGPYGTPFVHTGNFYFLEDQLYDDPYASYHADGKHLLRHPLTGKRRDLYWQPLPVYNFPTVKQR
jgi:hypothetical protein